MGEEGGRSPSACRQKPIASVLPIDDIVRVAALKRRHAGSAVVLVLLHSVSVWNIQFPTQARLSFVQPCHGQSAHSVSRLAVRSGLEQLDGFGHPVRRWVLEDGKARKAPYIGRVHENRGGDIARNSQPTATAHFGIEELLAEIALPACRKSNPVALHIPPDERPYLSFMARPDGVPDVFTVVVVKDTGLRKEGLYPRRNLAASTFGRPRIDYIGLEDNPRRPNANRENAGFICPFHLIEESGEAGADRVVPWESAPPTAESLL